VRERADVLRRLAPAALHAAGLGEAQSFRLYRALRVYSIGFQAGSYTRLLLSPA
jgi:hypothetical protein